MAALFVFGNRDQVDNQEIAKKQEILAETPLVSETKEEKPKESAKETVMEPVKRVVTPAPSVNTETAALEAELEDQYLEAEEFAEVSADEIIAEGFLRPDLFTLSWPVEGEVILPFSMDRSVYFKTLAQYQYNPAMLIGAEEGTEVFAAAKWKNHGEPAPQWGRGSGETIADSDRVSGGNDRHRRGNISALA